MRANFKRDFRRRISGNFFEIYNYMDVSGAAFECQQIGAEITLKYLFTVTDNSSIDLHIYLGLNIYMIISDFGVEWRVV